MATERRLDWAQASRTFADEYMHRTLAGDIVGAFIAQLAQVHVLEQMLAGAE
jgi:hypothetical protein